MKNLKICCCISVSFIPIIIVIALLFTRMPRYNHFNRRTLSFQKTMDIKDFFGIKKSLQLNPILTTKIVNDSRNPCFEPYEYACDHGERSIPDMVSKSNLLTLTKIIEKSFSDSNLPRKCKEFHGNFTIKERREMLKTHHIMTEIEYTINNEFNKENPNIQNIAAKLHKLGVREPFKINLFIDGSLVFGQPQRLLENNRYVIDYMLDHTYPSGLKHTYPLKIYKDYLEISSTIHFNEKPKYLKKTIGEIEATGFQILDYFKTPKKEDVIGIDQRMINAFVNAIRRFQMEKWRNYFFFVSYKSMLHQFRLLIPDPHSVCFDQIIQYFPYTICRKVRNDFEYDTQEINNYIKRLMDGFKKHILLENIFDFKKETIVHLSDKFDKIVLSVNECSFRIDNSTITSIENKYFNSGHQSYLDIISQMIKEEDFQMRRHVNYDEFYKDILINYIDWGAFYQGYLNMLIIPPGLLHFPMKYLETKSCQYHAMIDHVVYHELGHFIQQNVIHPSKKYNDFVSSVFSLYGTNGNGLRSKEDVADVFGFLMAYKTWNTFKSNVEKKCFFLSYIRQWCPHGDNNVIDKDHGSREQRAVLPLIQYKNEYEKVFNCTNLFFIRK